MEIDTDTVSQMERRARQAENCKVRARRLETVGGGVEIWWEMFYQSSGELNGISEGGANCIVSERADNEIEVGGREDPMRIEQKRMRELS